MTNHRSIGFQLSACYTSILAGILAIAAVGVWLGLRQSIHETADRDLRSRLLVANEYVDREYRRGGLRKVVSEMDEFATGPSGMTLQLSDLSGKWIYRSPEASHWPWAPPTADQVPKNGRVTTVTANGSPVRLLTAPTSVGIIQLGIPLDAFYHLLDEFSLAVLWASPILLAVVAISGYWVSRRALRPVDIIVQTARRIGDKSLGERLPLSGTGDELHRLSEALNEMLSRLENSFQKTRQFTADASHELRTPVAIVRTTAEVTRSKTRSVEDHMRAWETVSLQAERMSQLIEDLLLLARADDNPNQPGDEVIDLAEATLEACRDLEVMAQRADIRLDAVIPSSCPISGDYETIRRLISILLDNAIKYTPPGGNVGVSLEVIDSAHRRTVVLRVRDDGVGISSEDLPRIFDRFYRISEDRSRETGGAGLGLSIAQSIVRRHGGEIFVDSAPGVGSTFRVELPLDTKSPRSSPVLRV